MYNFTLSMFLYDIKDIIPVLSESKSINLLIYIKDSTIRKAMDAGLIILMSLSSFVEC